MKDHDVANIVNLLRDETKQYAETQQLRARIANIIVPLLRDADPALSSLLKSMRAVANLIMNDNTLPQSVRVECQGVVGSLDAWLNGNASPTEVLSNLDIQHIVDEMPGGIGGYMKSWGWLQFARRVEQAALTQSVPVKPPMYCKQCTCMRPGTQCWKCGTDLFRPSVEWEEPALPAVEPIRRYAKEIGYNIAEHGSRQRDLDVVAVPWTAEAAEYKPYQVADYIAERINARVLNPDGEVKPHGRVAFTLQIDGWFKMIDLSVIVASPVATEQNHDEHF